MCCHKKGTPLEIRLDLQFWALLGLDNDKACTADISLGESKNICRDRTLPCCRKISYSSLTLFSRSRRSWSELPLWLFKKCIKGSMDKRMLFSKTAGTLPVSSHNWVLQYLNYKLKIIFTGVILNIIWNFLTLPQPCYTTQLRLDLHVWCTWLKFCHITSWATKTRSINRRCNIWESKNI